uniref:UDP-N-acetylglucosamine transferase subunit ALG14 n=1 Tax=Crocodylus porosus TaxID=8502 RepID=A0A7M4F8Z2_CROPO
MQPHIWLPSPVPAHTCTPALQTVPHSPYSYLHPATGCSYNPASLYAGHLHLWLQMQMHLLLPIVLCFSGGHTTEMLRLLSSLSQSYSLRHYVFAESDKMSEAKIRSFEEKRAETFTNSLVTSNVMHMFTLNRIPRSREVRQSWISSVATTLYSMCYSLPLTVKLKPDLILCNGPGTCVPVCISALLLWILGLKKVIIVYVESICRVETLSLTGKILYYFSDYFIVQWPALKEKYPKSKYLGRIV